MRATKIPQYLLTNIYHDVTVFITEHVGSHIFSLQQVDFVSFEKLTVCLVISATHMFDMYPDF